MSIVIKATAEDEIRRAEAADDAARPSLAYSWFVVTFLMVLYTSSFIDRTILGFLVKPIREDLKIDDFQYSLLVGIAFVTMYSIAGIPLGYLVDRWSRKGIIAIGVTAWSVMTALCGVATSFPMLFTFRVGVGIGEATLSPASYSLISDIFPKEKLGRALSVYGLGIPLGSGLALLIGGRVIKAMTAIGPVDLPLIGVTQPWQTVFLAIGLPGLILALLSLLIVKEPKRHLAQGATAGKPSFPEALKFFWANRRVYSGLFMGMGFLAMFGYGSTQWYPSYLTRVRGFDVADAGTFLGLSTLVMGILGGVTAGWLSDRLLAKGRRDAHFLVSTGYCIGFAVCGVIGPLAHSPWISLPFISLSVFFSNTIIGVVAAALQIVTPNRMRGQISAMFLMAAAFIGLAFGPTAIGFATTHIFHDDNMVGYSLALVAAIFPTLGAVCFWLGRKPLLEKLVVQRRR